MAVLGLRFCARAFSSCGKWGPLFIMVRGPITIVASLVVEHRLRMRRLSSYGSRAYLLCGMWDLPRPGLEPVSPALAGRFSTTAPPGKPPVTSILISSLIQWLFRTGFLHLQILNFGVIFFVNFLFYFILVRECSIYISPFWNVLDFLCSQAHDWFLEMFYGYMLRMCILCKVRFYIKLNCWLSYSDSIYSCLFFV